MTDPRSQPCTATNREGDPCGRRAIIGGTVCASHGGRAPQVKAAAARRAALGEAMGELTKLGVAIDVEPADAMLDMVREAAGNVAFLRSKVQELEQKVGTELVPPPESKGTIAGPIGSSTKINEAARHVLVTMYDDERERLVRWAKACRDAGVDERRVQVAEDQGRQLADVLRGTLAAALRLVLDLVPADVAPTVRERWSAEVPAIVRQQIQSVSSREVSP